MGDLFSDDTTERPAITAEKGSKKPKKPKKQRSAVAAFALILLGLVVIVGGAWAAAYLLAEEKLPRNTEVAGVGIGNMSPAAAQEKLTSTLTKRLAKPLTLRVGSQSAEVTPSTAGVTLDVAATVEKAGVGQSWNPIDLWNHYTGGSAIDPELSFDEAKLTAAWEKINKSVGSPATDGAVAFGAEGVTVTDPVVGHGVEADAFRAALTEEGLAKAKARTASLPLVEITPEIDATDVQSAVTSFANPAMSGPVTLTFGKSPIVLRPSAYAGILSLKATDGALVPTVDGAGLDTLLTEATAERSDAPVDATVRLRNGKPVVVPAKPGVSFDQAQALSVFTELLAKPEGQRSATIASKVVEPAVSTQQAEAWNIKEKISTFTTYFPYAEYRNTNLGRAAQIINGTILAPGETFSLNGTVGERTRANGFTEGWTIQDGVFKSDLGGGVSQMATTLYNAGFFGGLEDVEHHAHSLYISRYPVGREATVAWGAKDLRFKNNTTNGVYIRAVVDKAAPGRQGAVTVSLWSTKTWDITTSTGSRYAQTDYKKRDIAGDNCEPTVGARGFQIDVKRYFHKPGEKAVVKTENIHTTYNPQDQVTCTGTVKNPA